VHLHAGFLSRLFDLISQKDGLKKASFLIIMTKSQLKKHAFNAHLKITLIN
jgi:hypothetical protein